MALTDDELVGLLADLESDRVERKAGLDVDRACEAVCAFGNDLAGHGLPGVLFVGADDVTGRPSGLTIDDTLLLKLAGLRDRGTILPLPTMSVRRLDVAGGAVAVVEVLPSLTPPLRFKGVVWVRVGPRRARASPDEERRLAERRRSLDLPFDARPLPGLTVDDLDLELFTRTFLPAAVAPEVLAENGRSDIEQLASLRLTDTGGTPTVTGPLLLGFEPRRHLPGAYVQFLRLDGQGLADRVRDDKVLDGALMDVLRQLDELLSLNVVVSVDPTATPELRRPDYPIVALQQLVRNAVQHRSYEGSHAPIRLTWYDDRVEIFSPGGPFGLVGPATFGQPGVTDYRNPTLTAALAAAGYVQRFGVGIEVARQACARNGNPEPEFTVEPSYVAVTLRRAA